MCACGSVSVLGEVSHSNVPLCSWACARMLANLHAIIYIRVIPRHNASIDQGNNLQRLAVNEADVMAVLKRALEVVALGAFGGPPLATAHRIAHARAGARGCAENRSMHRVHFADVCMYLQRVM